MNDTDKSHITNDIGDETRMDKLKSYAAFISIMHIVITGLPIL